MHTSGNRTCGPLLGQLGLRAQGNGLITPTINHSHIIDDELGRRNLVAGGVSADYMPLRLRPDTV